MPEPYILMELTRTFVGCMLVGVGSPVPVVDNTKSTGVNLSCSSLVQVNFLFLLNAAVG